MVELRVRTTSGEETVLDEEAVQEVKTKLRGEILTPGDSGYDKARQIWNGLADKRPGLITRCAGVADVIDAVNFARTNDLLVAVRGRGHSFPGHSVCDGGMVIDLSQMKGIHVDQTKRTVRAEAGVTLGELDRETQVFGLAVPAGVISTTGIAGLTLGGGNQGWLVRKHGSTVDNLLSVDIVTADGSFLTASATENEDLFWGVRGGGGNFGIATSFQYQLHSVGPLVLGGPIFYPLEKAKELLHFYRDYCATVPDELTSMFLLMTVPPAPFIPEHLHGKFMPAIGICYAGPVEAGEKVVQPLKSFGPPELDLVHALPYTMLQSMFDESAPHGILAYAKSDYYNELSDAMIDTIVSRAPTVPSPLSLQHLNHYGGAVSRVPADATPSIHRHAEWAFSFDSLWTDPDESDTNIQWTREFWEALRPFAAQGSYVNFLVDEGEDRIKEAYGPNYDRLKALKVKYDPTNMFRLNQNIRPTA